MIDRDLGSLQRGLSELFPVKIVLPVHNYTGKIGFFIRSDEGCYVCGNGDEDFDGIVTTYSILFRCALACAQSSVVLCVKGKLYSFDPKIANRCTGQWFFNKSWSCPPES